MEDFSPEALRDRLIAAAAGPRQSLRALCEQHKDRIIANVGMMCKLPDGMATDAASIDRYVQRLGAVAQCLADECNAPELWHKLCGTPDDNPLLVWERWYEELPRRMDRLEHDELIAEARSFIERSRTLHGTTARQQEAYLQGRLGQLLFHAGKVSDAIEPFQAALMLCHEIGDVEGQSTYLENLLEVCRYTGNVADATSLGEQLVELHERQGKDARAIKRRCQRLLEGEAACRIVCVRDDQEWELEETPSLPDGRYEFQFRRNRASLQKASALVRQGNKLAVDGQHADALVKYEEATEVDPHDPDPVYQSGACWLELGVYAQARQAFEQVERLAPAWFQCRSCLWLAESLESGRVSDDEFRLLRALEDGGMDPDEALQIAHRAVETYPEFAPFYLTLGDLQRDHGDIDSAILSYRAGLKQVDEPDLESRLLTALAGVLPKKTPERRTLIEHALSLRGSLVAQAAARLMGLQ